MLEGALEKLAARAADPAHYRLVVRGGAAGLDLNPWLGAGLTIEFLDRISCAHCAASTARSYGGGYCYGCVRTLARCDLCVLSPARCHYHLGTCREPGWGETFCMRPHVVYLANSSGPKVGITTAGGEITRWLDQGATQGLVVAEAPTRHLAGVLEAALTAFVSDRTDWRALLRGTAPAADLAALRDRLFARLGAVPDGVRWRHRGEPVQLAFPVLAYPSRLRRLRLDRHRRVAGRLIGIKGQYLLFEHGVFNVRWHRAFHVRVSATTTAEIPVAEPAAPIDAAQDDSQQELFS